MFQMIVLLILTTVSMFASTSKSQNIVYIASDRSIPFWKIMGKGVQNQAKNHGYEVKLLSSDNMIKKELQHAVEAISQRADALILSPVNSSSCVTISKLAQKANVPVVILDVGCDEGEYLSYISSNNKQGAYDIGKVLASKMKRMNLQNGKVGIVAIPQKRINGQLRTSGFMKAMNEEQIQAANIKQQVDFSLQETYALSKELIEEHSDLSAIWLQGSDKYQGALHAINEVKKDREILLITFDAEPIFLELIPSGTLLGAAMQQPFLMGQKAINVLHDFFHNKPVKKSIQLPILPISQDNIDEKLPMIKRNVLGLHFEQ